ncbi:MAG TPA: hypothetical protein VGO85_18995 [Caldimonas sp.]|nr:hypothetical protein [Caldimonas sp.]
MAATDALAGAAAFFATGAALCEAPCLGGAALAGAAFFAAVALLATGFFVATGLLAATAFFLAAGTALPLAAPARCEPAFLAGGRARAAGAATFFDVFLTANFFTGSPRNGGATFSRKARREGRDRFDRRGL